MYSSKAEQKRELDQLSKSYDMTTRYMQDQMLGDREYGGEVDKLYWEVPHYLHQWNEKKYKMFEAKFPSRVREVKALNEMRDAIKATPICKPEPKADSLEKKITKSIHEMLELRKKQYARGINLSEYFGGLKVTGNAHLVTNQYGTTFVRVFYYMHGEFTPLQVIIAVAQELKDKEEGK